MRIAITGAAGFLGRHLVAASVQRRIAVLPVVRKRDARSPVGAVEIEDVLHDPTCLEGCEALVHAAAVRHRHGVDPRTYHASNVALAERLFQAACGRVRRFVYVSSVGVYGFPSKLPISERHPYAPRTSYSVTKVEAELVLRRTAKKVGKSGPELVIVRPTIMYGAGDTNGMLDKMVRMIRAGTYRLVGDGSNALHHTHVDDVVDGIFLAATEPAARSEDFILAGPETTTLEALSHAVANALGAELPRVHVPLGFARAVASLIDVAAYRGVIFDKREPPINNEKLDVMTLPITFDVQKARSVLGFNPRVGYIEGIRRTVAAVNRGPSSTG